MATDNRGYPEVQGSETPDVSYAVNRALRAVDADVQGMETTLRGEVASVASRVGLPGKPLELEDKAMAGLLAKSGTATAKELARSYVRKSDVSGAGFPTWSGIQRMYLAGNTPEDGPLAGDLVLSIGGQPLGPASLGGCAVWFDASTVGEVGAGSSVFRMEDLSGHGRTLQAGADGANVPVFQHQGGSAGWLYPRLVFGNEDKSRWMSYTKSGDVLASGDFTVMMVAAPTAKPSGNSTLFGGNGTNVVFATSGGKWGIQVGNQSIFAAASGMVPNGTPHYFIFEYVAKTNTVILTVDGVEQVRGTITGAAPISGRITLGAASDTGANAYWGSIGEVAIFNRQLTALEKADLRTLSRTRWAVS